MVPKSFIITTPKLITVKIAILVPIDLVYELNNGIMNGNATGSLQYVTSITSYESNF